MRIEIITFLAVLSCAFMAKGQQKFDNPSVPKLIVGITIENFNPDYINRYYDTFQSGGFTRLVSDGAVYRNVRADIHNLKSTTIIPTIYTGVYPSEHGIVADSWYRQLSEKEISAVCDDYYLTLGSDSKEGNVSAKTIKTYTLGDALKLQTNSKSKVFSVGLNANSTALAAGHNADGAYWFDKTNGNFISSSYYIDVFPDWVMEFNAKKLPDFYLSKEWDLLLPEVSYSAGFEDDYILEEGFWKKWNTFPFNLTNISQSQEFPYELLKAVPWGNTYLRDFAVRLISEEKLGDDNYPDLLNITFSVLDYANKWYTPSSVEVQESCLRLNKDIASLLSYLDKVMGKGNYLVFLTSASTSGYPVSVLKDDFGFNAGEFMPQSAMALLRSYLNALYGVGDWIISYNEEQIYLNHNLIEKKEVSLDDMRENVASFLNQFKGIKAAVAANLIENGNLDNPRFKVLENSYCVQRSGDVMLLLEEGWYPTYRYHNVDYSTVNRVPLLFYGMNIKPQVNYEAVQLVDIVPSICKMIGILPPDDAKGKFLMFDF